MRRLILLISALLTAVFLAFPALAMNESEQIVVVLDAGHGGMDGGTIAGMNSEKVYNLKIAQYLRDELNADGRFNVIMTRDDDTYLKFLPRALYGLDSNADVFLSLHCNSNDYTGVRGGEAYITVVDEFSAYSLADKILRKIESTVSIPYNKIETREDTGDSLGVYYWNSEKQWDMPGAYSLGLKSDYYSINTWCSKFGIPSIIVEHGYLSNPSDAAIIDSDDNLKKIAKAEAEALIDYYFGHEHSFSTQRLTDHPANCTLNGAESYRCSICGAKKGTVTTPVQSELHYWRQASSKRATCTDDGYIEYVCQISYNLNDKSYDCEVHSYTEYLTATGHNYETLEDSLAGHGFDGLLYKKCTNCGDEIREIRTGEPHDYVLSSETQPDCTNEGIKTYKCSICGDTCDEKTPALEHDYEVKERVEATEESDGYVLSVCKICGNEEKELLSSCEHEFIDDSIAPTCDTDGGLVRRCTKCGAVINTVYPAYGHSYEIQMEVKPTCTESGFKRENCSRCFDVRTESYPPTGHTYEKDGDMLVCKFCGDTTEDTTKPDSLLSHPAVIIVLAIVVIQLSAAVVIIVRHRKVPTKK